ncbi:MAG: hypothetical protein ACI4WS_14735 [Oscillospiraceae bacterium]
MRKNIAVILAALLLCTACQSNAANSGAESSEPTSSTAAVDAGSAEPDESAPTAENAKTEEVTPAETTPQTSGSEVPEATDSASDAFFKPGVWQCSDYYFYEFYEDGTGGTALDFDCYIGQPFRYEVTDQDSGAVMFHIFSADDQSPATAKVISDTEIELTWDFGRTDNLTYLPGKTMDDIEAEFKNYFKPGTWRGETQYFFFDEDGMSGSTLSFDIGIGVGFRYEVMSRSEGFVNMHMGAEDNIEGVVISDKTEDSFTITWEDGSSEKFVYASPLTASEFVFYTDEQIVQIAQNYYQANNGGYTPGSAGTKSNEDGTVTIQLYDSFDDHNSTAAWYTIDRVTLKGTDDIMGTEVDMSGYAAQ